MKLITPSIIKEVDIPSVVTYKRVQYIYRHQPVDVSQMESIKVPFFRKVSFEPMNDVMYRNEDFTAFQCTNHEWVLILNVVNNKIGIHYFLTIMNLIEYQRSIAIACLEPGIEFLTLICDDVGLPIFD